METETLRSYVKKYQAGGISTLLQTHDSGKQVNLDEQQLAQWYNERDENIYLTTGSVIQYVEQAFGVAYSCRGMRDLLHREGYVFKNPVLVPGNPDRE